MKIHHRVNRRALLVGAAVHAALLGCAVGACTALMQQANAQLLEWGAVEVRPDYKYAYGVLSAPNYVGLRWQIDAGKYMDINRYWVHTLLLPGALLSINRSNADVWGDASSAYYDAISYAVNHGASTVVGDSRRVECAMESTGPCIPRKTAVSNRGPVRYGIWAHQTVIQGSAHVVDWVQGQDAGANTQFVQVVASDVDVQNSVQRWNRSAGSTGDYLQILAPDGRIIFRISGDGHIYRDGVEVGR